MHPSQLVNAVAAAIVAITVALALAAVSGTMQELWLSPSFTLLSSTNAYLYRKGFLQADDLYAVALVPLPSAASTYFYSSSIVTPALATRLITAVKQIDATAVQAAAERLTGLHTELLGTTTAETSTVNIVFGQNQTVAATGVMVDVDNMKEAKALVVKLSTQFDSKKHKLTAVRLTTNSCDATFEVYPSSSSWLPSYSRIQEKLVVKRTSTKRVRIAALTTHGTYVCTITTINNQK